MFQTSLKEFSPITYTLERLFYLLQFLSPANVFYPTRVSPSNANKAKQQGLVNVGRARFIEFWILLSLSIEIITNLILGHHDNLTVFILAFPLYRIFDIFQATINLNVFDPLRMGNKQHYTASVTRTLLLSMINFVEVMLCYVSIYLYNLELLKVDGRATDVIDAFYFSVITQLTIGYGDIHPLKFIRVVASLQGLTGFILGIFALSRFVSLLPPTVSVPSGTNAAGAINDPTEDIESE